MLPTVKKDVLLSCLLFFFCLCYFLSFCAVFILLFIYLNDHLDCTATSNWHTVPRCSLLQHLDPFTLQDFKLNYNPNNIWMHCFLTFFTLTAVALVVGATFALAFSYAPSYPIIPADIFVSYRFQPAFPDLPPRFITPFCDPTPLLTRCFITHCLLVSRV